MRSTIFSVLILLLLVVAGVAGTIRGDFSFYQGPVDGPALPLTVDGDVQNVILLIGDGMGLNQVNAAQFAAVGPEKLLHMQTMPVTGLMGTYSHDRLITDSAASGTAIASGRKTNNGMVGMLPDGGDPITLTDAARDAGMATGVVATSGVTHATPASFLAHDDYRYHELAIAEDIAQSGADVIFGGGWRHFVPAPEGERQDSVNLIKQMQEDGYTYIQIRDELETLDRTPALGLFRHGPLNEDADEPSVADLTRKAIDLLRADDDGFFLLVEGSQIDWEAHSNEEDELVRRLLRFDLAVAEALNFARENGHTLVIVTSDHETGGMSLTKGNRDGSEIVAQFTSPNHTAGMVPVFVYGPGALEFTGVYDNTDIAKKLARVLELQALLDELGPGQTSLD